MLYVIAPAGKISDDEYKKLTQVLDQSLIPYQLPRNYGDSDPLCSSPSEDRLYNLLEALESDQNPVIWALRGGYGSIQLLQSLAERKIKTKSQIKFVGFSDLTSLHHFILTQYQQPTLHGPHIGRLSQGGVAPLIEFYNEYILAPKPKTYTHQLQAVNKPGETLKNLKAKCWGGNLVTLQSLIGTPWGKPLPGILILEEVNEPAYKIDRILYHMTQAGFFKQTQALVFGDLTHPDKDERQRIQKTIKHWAEKQSLPVYSGLKVGHEDVNQALYFGTPSEMELKEGKHLLFNRNWA